MRDESFERQVHDALRGQGLVPAAEDVHYGACSTEYRTKLRVACKEVGDHGELHRRIRSLTAELDRYRRNVA